MKSLRLFSTDKIPKMTPNRLTIRLDALKDASNFIAENDNQRKAMRALYENISLYSKALDIFADMIERPSNEKLEYDKKKYDYAINCGGVEQDAPNGGIQVVGIKDMEKFQESVRKLNIEYKEALEEDNSKQQRNDALFSMEIDDLPEPYKTNIDYFPDSIGADKLAAIDFMLINGGDNEKNV